MNKLVSFEKTLVASAGSAKKETTFLLQNGATRPTLGRYEILQELGQGAMGTVYLGRDPSIQRQVAVKTLNYEQFTADELRDVKARFFREAEAAGKLSHPHIVTIYDVGEDHDMAYIAMELLGFAGGTDVHSLALLGLHRDRGDGVSSEPTSECRPLHLVASRPQFMPDSVHYMVCEQRDEQVAFDASFCPVVHRP